MWKEIIQKLLPDAGFYRPASQEEIQAAEMQLGIVFPTELKDLLTETDGLNVNCGARYIFGVSSTINVYDHFVWQNEEMRHTPDFAELYAPFDNIFFIGADGGGSLFGYEISDAKCTSSIIYWENEDDTRLVVSTTGLKGYLEYAATMYSS